MAVLVGANLAACQPPARETEIVESINASPTALPQVNLSLRGGDYDVWSWTAPVQVKVSEPGACEGLVVYVDEQEFRAQADGDTFTAEVNLSEEENQVRAVCLSSAGEAIESEPVVITERLRQVPTAMIQIEIENGGIVLDGSESQPAEDGIAISEYLWSAREDNPQSFHSQDGALTGQVRGQTITIQSPAANGEYFVSLRVQDEEGRQDTSTSYFVVEDGQPRVPDYEKENPAWTEQAIVYGVIPFLFGSPAFDAITERLDDLADLGVNTLWLGPINQHPADDFGYAVEDYFALDPAYGTEKDFRELVDAAHARNMRVIMDFVPNHTSNTHPYFRDAQQRGEESPYWDFYDRDETGAYTYYFEWTHLPNLNYDNPQVQRMMLEAFSYWVREFNVDGFRVDVVWGVKERYPEFWPEWRHELKRIKPDLLLLAEASARDPYYFDNGFDAAYDWTNRPGGWAWDIVWSGYKYRLLAYNLTTALTNRPDGYHPDALIFRFINNNDTGKRFITRHSEGATRVATALLLTLPGIPSIYTGDEYGLEFEPYQQVEPLTFEEGYPGLRDYHKKLISLRKALPSLHSRNWQLIEPDAVPQAVYSYIRYGEPDDAPVLVLLNFSEEPTEFEFDLPGEFSNLQRSSLYDLLADEEVPAMSGGRMQISVPALTARILTAELFE